MRVGVCFCVCVGVCVCTRVCGARDCIAGVTASITMHISTSACQSAVASLVRKAPADRYFAVTWCKVAGVCVFKSTPCACEFITVPAEKFGAGNGPCSSALMSAAEPATGGL